MPSKTKAPPPETNNRLASMGVPTIKLSIPQLTVRTLEVEIVGISPLIIRAWDQKTQQELADKQSGKKNTKSRENKTPQEVFDGARYRAVEGDWDGIPATAFKAALVDAVSCLNISLRDFSMTVAKKCFFIKPQGIDKLSGRDLVRIYGTPEIFAIMQPTSAGGPYMSYRPIYRDWRCQLAIEFNAAKIDAQGVMNLLANAGYFVGVGEHRPASKESKTGTSGRWKIAETQGVLSE